MFKLPPPGERRPPPLPQRRGPSIWHLIVQLLLVIVLIWYLLGIASE